MRGFVGSGPLCPAVLLAPLLAAGFAVPLRGLPEPPPTPPTPAPSPSPIPSPRQSPRPRLRLDVDRHVGRAVEKEAEASPPRFKDSVAVDAQTPQAMFERHLEGLHLECGPTGGGAPTEIEPRAVRPHASPSADFVPLLKALGRAVRKNKGEDRFFLYRVESSGRTTFVVRTERIPESWRLSAPGTTYTLVEAYPDMASAASGLRRLEQGFVHAERKDSGAPAPPWATAMPCRPR